jgi:hypothetical protein
MPDETITLPVSDVAALVRLGWELTRYINETDTSATGSIYGIEHAHKTIAKVAARLPIKTNGTKPGAFRIPAEPSMPSCPHCGEEGFRDAPRGIWCGNEACRAFIRR